MKIAIAHTNAAWRFYFERELVESQLKGNRLTMSLTGDVLTLTVNINGSPSRFRELTNAPKTPLPFELCFSETAPSPFEYFGKTEVPEKFVVANGPRSFQVKLGNLDLKPVKLRGSMKLGSTPQKTGGGPIVTQQAPTLVSYPSLRELVRSINERKREIGDELVFSITPEGMLRALVEYC